MRSRFGELGVGFGEVSKRVRARRERRDGGIEKAFGRRALDAAGGLDDDQRRGTLAKKFEQGAQALLVVVERRGHVAPSE